MRKNDEEIFYDTLPVEPIEVPNRNIQLQPIFQPIVLCPYNGVIVGNYNIFNKKSYYSKNGKLLDVSKICRVWSFFILLLSIACAVPFVLNYIPSVNLPANILLLDLKTAFLGINSNNIVNYMFPLLNCCGMLFLAFLLLENMFGLINGKPKNYVILSFLYMGLIISAIAYEMTINNILFVNIVNRLDLIIYGVLSIVNFIFIVCYEFNIKRFRR